MLVQPGEEQLAAQAVVVADPAAGDGEAEDPVEDDGVLDEFGVPACFRVRLFVLFDLHGFPEGRQVAAQLLEGVQEERHPLFDHEGIERQVPAHVRAVMDQIPHDEGLFGEFLVLEEFRGFRRQLQRSDVGRGPEDAAEAGRFPVRENARPR